MKLHLEPIKPSHVPFIVNYWCNNDGRYLESLGVELKKLPNPSGIELSLKKQMDTPLSEKTAYALIAYLDGVPIGHCNLNPIKEKHAFIHIHIWDKKKRKLGCGTEILKLAIQRFFNELEIDTILAEPMASNDAPNKVLRKARFSMVKTYITTPGEINFEQTVNRWQINKANLSH